MFCRRAGGATMRVGATMRGGTVGRDTLRAMRAIVTGASSGIGAALARELARRGWDIALLARRADLLDALVGELPTKSIALACDVGDASAVREAVRRGEEALGGPFDLAVANAGVGVPSHAAKFVLADAELMIRVNVLGMFNLFDAVIPSMVERRSGRFAGVASLAGLRGLPATSVYSASKAAMQAFLNQLKRRASIHVYTATLAAV